MEETLIGGAKGSPDGSVQARAEGYPGLPIDAYFNNVLTLRVGPFTDGITPWSYWPRKRDSELRRFSHSEPVLAGGMYAKNSRARALQWEIRGDSQRKKKNLQALFNDAQYGQGLSALAGLVQLDLDTTDNGAFVEIWATGNPASPIDDTNLIQGFAHMDSNQVMRTFDPEFPAIYIDPLTGQYHKMHKTRIIMLSQMTQPNEMARGLGFCAVSRALRAVHYMRNVEQFKDEKVSGRFNRAVGFGKGFTGKALKAALEAADKDDAAAGLTVYRNIPFIFPPGTGNVVSDVDLKLLDLASLPDGFNFESELTLYVYILALAFGTDARDFWPATSSGATKADASVQNMKAQGKGIADFIQTLEWAFNKRFIKEGSDLKFVYDFVDDEQDKNTAQVNLVRTQSLVALVSAGILAPNQALAQAIALKVVDPSALPPPETPTTPAAATPATDDQAGQGNSTNVAPGQKPGQPPVKPGTPPPPPTNAEKQAAVKARIETGFKAIQATQLDFEMDMEDLIAAAQAGDMERRRAGIVQRALVSKYGRRAYEDGLQAGGVDDPASDEDMVTINSIIDEQSEYVTGFLDELYSNLEGDFSRRPTMWFKGTIMAFYSAGLQATDANPMMECAGDDGEKSCPDCQRLKGQRHRYKSWLAHNLEMGTVGQATECGGWQCDHKLVRTEGRAYGDF